MERNIEARHPFKQNNYAHFSTDITAFKTPITAFEVCFRGYICKRNQNHLKLSAQIVLTRNEVHHIPEKHIHTQHIFKLPPLAVQVWPYICQASLLQAYR